MKEDIYEVLIKLLPERLQSNIVQLSYQEIIELSLADLGVSSMQSIELIMKLEEKFEMEFDPADLLQFNSLQVQDIIHKIEPHFDLSAL